MISTEVYMDERFKQDFLAKWEYYFPGAELPLAFFYSDTPAGAEIVPGCAEHRCLICDLAKARKGTPLCFDAEGAVCTGAKRYLGFTQELRPGFEYFLSCGIKGEMEGERYKKTPELVRELLAKFPRFTAPGRYGVFKRWDALAAADEPAIVIFFATPDVLSGLFTLAGFEVAETEAVIAPFAAGCGSIVQYPYLELKREPQRAVLGMFDVSARPCVPEGVLSFAVPLPKFERMVADMDQSFLTTESWRKVRRRIGGPGTD
jgi:hypothetical protein